MRVIITLALTFMTAFTTASAEEPPMVPIKRLSLDYATRAAVATVEACREKGMNVAVAIVDRGGRLQVLLRDTLAMPLTNIIAEQKAYAALNFNAPTSEMEDRFTSVLARKSAGDHLVRWRITDQCRWQHCRRHWRERRAKWRSG